MIDQAYRTGSVTAFMPLWLLMALASLTVVLRRTPDTARGLAVRALRPAVLATVLMTGGVMGYGYLANRYTSEFVPALVVGSIITFWALLARWAALSRVLAVGLGVLLALGGLFSVAAQAAVGFATAASLHGGEDLARYVVLQDQTSGGPGTAFAGLISHSDDLPVGGRADDLHIRGDCDGLYLNTGDSYQPWVIVEERSRVVSVRFPERMPRALVPLFVTHGDATRRIFLHTWRDGTVQIGIRNETGDYLGPLFRPFPGEVLRVGLRTDSSLGYMELSSTPGGFVGYVPIQEWGRDWISRIGSVDELASAPDRLPGSGIRVDPGRGLTPTVCERLARDNGIDLS